ncbi:isopeptide-forming domain-containing fimbrial protein, partial [Enterococcus faecalis]
MKKTLRVLLLLTLLFQYTIPITTIAQENSTSYSSSSNSEEVSNEQKEKQTTETSSSEEKTQQTTDEINKNQTETNNQEKSNAPPNVDITNDTSETSTPKKYSRQGVNDVRAIDPSSYPYYIINGSFEEPVIATNSNRIMNQSLVPGWQTTATDSSIELANGTGGAHNFKPAEGKQFAEINANTPGELHQLVQTYPGETLRWELWHAGRDQTDTMAINIGTSENHPVQRTVSSPNRVWTKYTGTYTVPSNQTLTYFGFKSISSVLPSYGNYIDGIKFYVDGTLESKKTSDKEVVYAGSSENLTYTIEVKNTSERGVLYNVDVSDNIPDGLELIANSLEVDGTSVNNDASGNKVSTKVKEVAPGQTVKVTFNVKVTTSDVKSIRNVATVIDPNKPDSPQYPESTINTIKKPGKLVTEKTVYDKDGNSVGNQ